MYFAILGRNPSLSLVELESIKSTSQIRSVNETTAFFMSTEDLSAENLGSIIRIGNVIPEVTAPDFNGIMTQLHTFLLEHASKTEGKITLGVSLAAQSTIQTETIQKKLRDIKKDLKSHDTSLRVIPSKQLLINIATFRSNKLNRMDKKLEIVCIETNEGWRLGVSSSAPDIDGFAARDRRKPFRDSRNGMLPPQLARTLVNIATQGQYSEQTLLDPFCGSGTVLLEARTLGIKVVGTDINPAMSKGSLDNLAWQDIKLGSEPSYTVQAADAQTANWSDITTCAAETYLGTPFTTRPSSSDVQAIISEINELHMQFFANLARQTQSGFRAAVAVPAWITSDHETPTRLSVIDSLSDLGYNHVEFAHRGDNSPLLYRREGQFVARDIIVVTRK